MNNLKSKTIYGISWSIIDNVSHLFLTLLIGSVLARLLTPDDFGLIAMIFVFTGFLKILRDFGIGASVIQKTKPTPKELDSLFFVSILFGLLVSTILIVFSNQIAFFYEIPSLNKLIKVVSIAMFLGSVSIIPESLIRKELKFKSLFFRNICNLIISGSITIILAYNGYGVWALIYKEIIYNFLLIIFNFSLINWRPSFNFSYECIKPYISFSLPLFGENSLNHFVRNLDNLLIGKLFGDFTLGVYSKAYSLMLLPVRQISGSIANVMFPSLSIIKNEKQKVWRGYLKIVQIISFINFPIMISMYFFATEIVLILFGSQWLDVIPIVKALCFIGSLQSIGTLAGSIYNSQGKTILQFKVGLVSKAFMSLAIVYGLFQGGILSMIFYYTVISTVFFVVELYFLTKILNNSISSFIHCLKKEIFVICIYLFFMTTLFQVIDHDNLLHKIFVQFLVLIVFIFISTKLNLSAIQMIKKYISKKA